MRAILVAPFVALALAAATGTARSQDGNSTRKIRPEPSEDAARAGRSIAWFDDVDAALAKAKETGEPVFWYVPTIDGTYMDRKVEIDRYMLSGPFSWPRTVALLGEHYVAVRCAASKELEKRFGIDTVEFIEPGYLVLSPEGEEVWRVDSLTTFQPRWFLAPLEDHVGAKHVDSDWPGALTPEALDGIPAIRAATKALAEHTVLARTDVDVSSLEPARAAEALWIAGALACRAGNDAFGRELFERLAAEHPDHPLGPKARMELEGHGPFLHGFEVYAPLPRAALDRRGRGSQAPAPMEEADLWRRSARFLAELQNDAGGLHDSIYDFGGTDGLPNVFVAVTAIAAIGLEEAVANRGVDEERALELARRYVLDDSNVAEVDVDEKIWAHLYRLRYVLDRIDAAGSKGAPEMQRRAKRLADLIVSMQDDRGAWYHEYSNPFVTASCLVALHEASTRGVDVDREVVARGLDALERCRTPEGAFTYGMPRREARAAVEAGVGRSPICELALLLWGRSTQDRLLESITASFDDEAPFFAIQKYDNHTRFHAFGGFFFWYGLEGRIEAIAHLEDASARQRFAERAREQILALPEIDGCFVDSHELGRAYGTGSALWCLTILGRIAG
ncbi:MAG: hypothetical protein R3F34_17120 [Planctomycetota bacterium]